MNVVLSRDQIRRIDRLAIDRYRIPGIILMENAGRNAARIIRRTYGEAHSARIICGPGNNGGDGCVIARHLHNVGWHVRVLLAADESRLSGDMRTNLDIVRAMGLEIAVAPDGAALADWTERITTDEIVVDALLGTGFQGAVRSPTAELISRINDAAHRATVAVDVPSGLDCDSGEPSNATIRADLTITFVAPKPGLTKATARPFIGRLEVADIGAPRELIEAVANGSA